MNEEEKKAIEYIKSRLYGNEGCDYIDVAQEDLRIFINLVDRKEKDIEGWKKYCEEIEEEQTEMSNKNCELEFEVEKLQKENEEWQRAYQEEKDKQFDFINKISSNDSIPVQKVKDKISERQFELQQEYKDFEDDSILLVLQELLEGRK